MFRDTALYFSSFVLKPYLHASRRHTQLVSKMDSCLLVGHLVCLEDLLQNSELVRTSSLPLLLVEEIGLGLLVTGRQFDPMKLEQDHRQKHDLPFIVLVIQVKLSELLALRC